MSNSTNPKFSRSAEYFKKIEGRKPTVVKPIEVKVKNNFDDSHQKFKSLFQKERILGMLKEKQYYEKPSEKKRRKRKEAHERRLMMAERERLIRTGEWDKIQEKKEKKRQQKQAEKEERRQQREFWNDLT